MYYTLEVVFATVIRAAQKKGYDLLSRDIDKLRYKYGIKKAKFNPGLLECLKHCTWQNLVNYLINIAVEAHEFDLQVTLQEYIEEVENEYKRRTKNRKKI